MSRGMKCKDMATGKAQNLALGGILRLPEASFSFERAFSSQCRVEDLMTMSSNWPWEAYLPLFFVLGACPNAFCGMQALISSSFGLET